MLQHLVSNGIINMDKDRPDAPEAVASGGMDPMNSLITSGEREL